MAHSEYKKRSSFLPFVIFRIILSLSMLCILGVGVYQAFRYFSGVDPVKLDPETLIASVLSSPDTESLVHKIFSIKFPGNVNELKNLSQGSLNSLPSSTAEPERQSNAPVVLKFAVVTDSHTDNRGLGKALLQAKNDGAKFVIGLGDYTDVGTDQELTATKDTFQASGLPFYLTAGDHDLWNSRDKDGEAEASTHFTKILGSPYQSFTDSNIRFLIIYNSDNYQGIDPVQMGWIQDEFNRIQGGKYTAVFAFMHEPLYHPSSDHIMGKKTQSLISQAGLLTQNLSAARVDEVFYGDVHFFSRYKEPKTGLKMSVVGALTSTRNTQKPRFVEVQVHADGIYNVKDIELQ